MLPSLKEYHRPASLNAALALLNRPHVRTVPLAGGTALIGSGDRSVEAVVDLQDLALRYIEARDARLHIGAMTTLQQLVASVREGDPVRAFLARAARAAADRIHRNMATIGGTVALSDAGDILLLSLLALNSQVVLAKPDGSQAHISLADLAANPRPHLAGALITEINVPLPTGRLGTGLALVGRTPRDRPIVGAAAVIRKGEQGSAYLARTAMGGVAARPYVLTASLTDEQFPPTTDALLRAGVTFPEAADTPDDFRGSAEYRREVAKVAAWRALQEAWEGYHEG